MRLQYAFRIAMLRMRYKRTLERLRRKVAHGDRLKVVFLVSELAKWKGPGVFEKLRSSKVFEPLVAVMNLTRCARLPLGEQHELLREKLSNFAERGIPAVDIQYCGSKSTRTICELDADIVFYQQPWDLPPQLKPLRVSRRALTFYFPYFTPNYSDTEMEIGHKLHHFLFGHFVCNEQMAEFYRAAAGKMEGGYAGEFLPLGHPMLDDIPFDPDGGPSDGCVIYAPHWTIEFGSVRPELRYSTFLGTGRFMLEYAKAHPDVKWAFKPHPELKSALVKSGAMTREEVEAYYAEWERLGECCYSGPDDYVRLFARSRALVTDCGSFLTEYGCTGKPIIRVVNPRLNAGSQPMVASLYATYYNVLGVDQLRQKLDAIVVRREDPCRGERLKALKAADLVGHDAAGSIARYLERLVSPA